MVQPNSNTEKQTITFEPYGLHPDDLPARLSNGIKLIQKANAIDLLDIMQHPELDFSAASAVLEWRLVSNHGFDNLWTSIEANPAHSTYALCGEISETVQLKLLGVSWQSIESTLRRYGEPHTSAAELVLKRFILVCHWLVDNPEKLSFLAEAKPAIWTSLLQKYEPKYVDEGWASYAVLRKIAIDERRKKTATFKIPEIPENRQPKFIGRYFKPSNYAEQIKTPVVAVDTKPPSLDDCAGSVMSTKEYSTYAETVSNLVKIWADKYDSAIEKDPVGINAQNYFTGGYAAQQAKNNLRKTLAKYAGRLGQCSVVDTPTPQTEQPVTTKAKASTAKAPDELAPVLQKLTNLLYRISGTIAAGPCRDVKFDDFRIHCRYFDNMRYVIEAKLDLPKPQICGCDDKPTVLVTFVDNGAHVEILCPHCKFYSLREDISYEKLRIVPVDTTAQCLNLESYAEQLMSWALAQAREKRA